jgi:ribonuclease HII
VSKMATQKKVKYLIGIDEAGRGPLAGPVAVGVILVPFKFDWSRLPGVGDSKALSEKKREEVFEAAEAIALAAGIHQVVIFKSAKEIDKKGIAVVIREAVGEGLSLVTKLAGAEVGECKVLLDGSLRAPLEYTQETIIKGDSKEPVIGLASIYAKVERDRYMTTLASKAKYSQYSFAKHKGYGTKTHRASISQFGPSDEHRVTFCGNCLPKSKKS